MLDRQRCSKQRRRRLSRSRDESERQRWQQESEHETRRYIEEAPARLGRALRAGRSACAALGIGPAAAQDAAEKPNILFIMGDDIGYMQPSIYHRGLMVGETPNIDRIGAEGATLHRLLRRAELHRRAQRLLHRHAPAPHRHDPAAAARQPVLPAARHPGDRLVPARPRLQHRRVRQEPPRRPHRRAADRARLPRVLGLSLPPRRDAGGELPRHQQDPDRADRRAGLPQHADPRPAPRTRPRSIR